MLKIANPAEDPAILDMQSQALLHIAQADPGLEIPRVKTTPDGALFRQIDGPDGRRFIARVLSFLPGDFLDDASPHPALERNVGAMTARLARALRGFFHPAARHELLWDLTQASGLRTLTHHIRESTLRQATEEVLDHFDAEVLPRLRKLRAQLIHNDISGFNTLVDGDRVSGVIDFEDLIHAPLICDIAVPIAELMARHMEPIATAAEVTAGYHAVTALEDDELPPCLRPRLHAMCDVCGYSQLAGWPSPGKLRLHHVWRPEVRDAARADARVGKRSHVCPSSPRLRNPDFRRGPEIRSKTNGSRKPCSRCLSDAGSTSGRD